MLSLSPDALFIYRAVKGADACAEEPSTCDLSRSIVAEDGAVTFHLSRPDTDFPFKLALPFAYPVPETVPLDDLGLEGVPATGPYMVGAVEGNELELVRNPGFREWSAAAQPDGFVDAITWTFGQEPETSVERLTSGELDWMTDPPPPDDLDRLRATNPDQVVLAPQYFTVFVGFDVAKPPMDDERLRQAVNFAIDREHIVDLLGGPTRQRPTCQILPPNFQGYEPYCPYTLGAGGGVWSAPDVLRARELVDEAGAVGREVTVWAMDDPGVPGSIDVMRYVTAIMNDLGLDAELEVKGFQRYVETIYLHQRAGSPGAPDVYLGGWITDYPRAADFLDSSFRCGAGANASGHCDERLDRRLEEVQRLQATDPARANQTWTEIEHDLVDQALWAPLSNPVFASAISDRVGNEQIHPIWSVLLSRLWVQ
jgi:peptide/nickel transport system substrate-binding protein